MLPSNALSTLRRTGLAMTAALTLAGCGAADRIANIGRAPDLTPIQNPVGHDGYTPVRMPMPTPQVAEQQANSLWQAGARAFFRDQRARNVGDILTVVIKIDDEARLNNSTERTRDSREDADLPAFFGIEGQLDNFLPDEVSADSLVDFGSGSRASGDGQISRDEKIELMVAAVVTQVLPNGNLVLYGRQEVRVNYEVRDLEIAGVIRPEDITSTNQISYEKIAEARISYGGRGQITDVQQPRYGQQLYDIIFPF